jgi:hypothetical protein
MGGGRAPQAGEGIALITVTGDGSGFIGAIANDGAVFSAQKGAALFYDEIRVSQTGAGPGSSIIATIRRAPRLNPQMKAVSEGFVGGAALVTQGGDTVAGPGLSNAVRAARGAGAGGGEGAALPLAGFGALSAGSMRYNSGSHVDMRSVSLLAGLSFGADLTPGRLTLGAFFEYGNGS